MAYWVLPFKGLSIQINVLIIQRTACLHFQRSMLSKPGTPVWFGILDSGFRISETRTSIKGFVVFFNPHPVVDLIRNSAVPFRILRNSEIPNPESQIRNPKSGIPNPKSEIRNPESTVPTQTSHSHLHKALGQVTKPYQPSAHIQGISHLACGHWSFRIRWTLRGLHQEQELVINS